MKQPSRNWGVLFLGYLMVSDAATMVSMDEWTKLSSKGGRPPHSETSFRVGETMWWTWSDEDSHTVVYHPSGTCSDDENQVTIHPWSAGPGSYTFQQSDVEQSPMLFLSDIDTQCESGRQVLVTVLPRLCGDDIHNVDLGPCEVDLESLTPFAEARALQPDTSKPATTKPTKAPTKSPTRSPTKPPTKSPTKSPAKPPTKSPTKSPTKTPTKTPTTSLTQITSDQPTVSSVSTPTPTADVVSVTEAPSALLVVTPSPTVVTTQAPVPSPTPRPTPRPTPEPTVATPSPTAVSASPSIENVILFDDDIFQGNVTPPEDDKSIEGPLEIEGILRFSLVVWDSVRDSVPFDAYSPELVEAVTKLARDVVDDIEDLVNEENSERRKRILEDEKMDENVEYGQIKLSSVEIVGVVQMNFTGDPNVKEGIFLGGECPNRSGNNRLDRCEEVSALVSLLVGGGFDLEVIQESFQTGLDDRLNSGELVLIMKTDYPDSRATLLSGRPFEDTARQGSPGTQPPAEPADDDDDDDGDDDALLIAIIVGIFFAVVLSVLVSIAIYYMACKKPPLTDSLSDKDLQNTKIRTGSDDVGVLGQAVESPLAPPTGSISKHCSAMSRASFIPPNDIMVADHDSVCQSEDGYGHSYSVSACSLSINTDFRAATRFDDTDSMGFSVAPFLGQATQQTTTAAKKTADE